GHALRWRGGPKCRPWRFGRSAARSCPTRAHGGKNPQGTRYANQIGNQRHAVEGCRRLHQGSMVSSSDISATRGYGRRDNVPRNRRGSPFWRDAPGDARRRADAAQHLRQGLWHSYLPRQLARRGVAAFRLLAGKSDRQKVTSLGARAPCSRLCVSHCEKVHAQPKRLSMAPLLSKQFKTLGDLPSFRITVVQKDTIS